MDKKNAVIRRLRRIEGQIKGIQKMVEEDKFCGDILTQVSAARAALNSAGGLILENYIKICIKEYMEENGEQDLDKLVETMVKYTKNT
ncbi:MAG TPA: metal-sensitive transcriptional regulator [Tissierellaceae bacterium]|nr:metal-sensitive transcriptional regulator [Tissierellaceae bacterium]